MNETVSDFLRQLASIDADLNRCKPGSVRYQFLVRFRQSTVECIDLRKRQALERALKAGEAR